jgi:hypothetical protein
MKSNLFLLLSAIILILIKLNYNIYIKSNSIKNKANKAKMEKLFKYKFSFLKKSMVISYLNIEEKNLSNFNSNKNNNELNKNKANNHEDKLNPNNKNVNIDNNSRKELSYLKLKVGFNKHNNTSFNSEKEKEDEKNKINNNDNKNKSIIIHNETFTKNYTISNILMKTKTNNNNNIENINNFNKNNINNVNTIKDNKNKDIKNNSDNINNYNNNNKISSNNLSINSPPIHKLKLISKIEELDKNTNLNTELNSNLNTELNTNLNKELNTNESESLNYTNSNLGILKYIFVQKVLLALSIYLQLFIIFLSLSFLKFYEEFFKMKNIFCNNKYSLFTVLTQKNKNEILTSTDNLIFSSGKPDIITTAKDEFFEFFLLKKFIKIERIVEIYDITEKTWKILGKKNNNFLKKFSNENTRPDFFEDFEGNCFSDNNDCNKYDYNKYDSNNSNSKIIEISFNDKIFTFPRIFSEVNKGKVYIYILYVFYFNIIFYLGCFKFCIFF